MGKGRNTAAVATIAPQRIGSALADRPASHHSAEAFVAEIASEVTLNAGDGQDPPRGARATVSTAQGVPAAPAVSSATYRTSKDGVGSFAQLGARRRRRRNNHAISALRRSPIVRLERQAGPVRQWLTRFFRGRVANDSEVDDMVQDVFVRIVARNGSEPVEHLGAYVMRTATSVLADRSRWRRSRQADLHIVFDPDQHSDEDFDPERVLKGKEDLNAAIAALLSLPERTRTVFVLRRLEGYKHRDIAAHLGISVSAVEKHMVKAISHLMNMTGERRAS